MIIWYYVLHSTIFYIYICITYFSVMKGTLEILIVQKVVNKVF